MKYMHSDIIKETECLIKESYDNTFPQDGIMNSYEQELPEYRKIAYFAPFQYCGVTATNSSPFTIENTENTVGKVMTKERIGGLLNNYYCDAAWAILRSSLKGTLTESGSNSFPVLFVFSR